MDPKSGQSLKSKVVSVKSLASTKIPQKAGEKIPTSPLLPVRGNRTAYRRIQLAHSSLAVCNSVLDMSWCRLPLVPEPPSPQKKPKKLKKLEFLCSDQQVITVPCALLFRYTEELRTFREEDLPIPLPAIHSETLLRIISWMRKHKLEESEGYCSAAVDSRWEEDLLEGSGNLCDLMDLIMAAFHLGLNILARHASEYLQERLAAKTDSEMSLLVQISNKLASDEEVLYPLVD